jgi:hypothetical protein
VVGLKEKKKYKKRLFLGKFRKNKTGFNKLELNNFFFVENFNFEK